MIYKIGGGESRGGVKTQAPLRGYLQIILLCYNKVDHNFVFTLSEIKRKNIKIKFKTMAEEKNNQGAGENQNQNQNNNDGNQGGGEDNQNQGGKNDGGDGGEKLEAVKNADGTITIDGKKYVDGESYQVLSEKQRQYSKEKEAREAQEKKDEDARLAEEGKFKELAETKDKEIETLKGNYTREKKVNALQAEATKLGAVDLDAVVKLANMDEVKLSEDGSIDTASVASTIENLKKEKSYLFAEGGQANIGSDGGAPSGGNGTPSFKRSQLRDHAFYKEHEKEISQAYKEGKIIDDLS